MQILLANAKVMFDAVGGQPSSVPAFQPVAELLAHEMAQLSTAELAKLLDCSPTLAAENRRRYKNFDFADKMPALMAYNGQAYKHLKADTLDPTALGFAQQHLFITCFLYGLLRPMDGIVPYRMEHTARLQTTAREPLSRFWRDRLTDFLIERVKADDGVLLHLSTAEYENLFHWKRVCAEVRVVQPLFYVRNKVGELKMQAVWAKACRGAMVRFVLQNRLTDPECLKAFQHEGFAFNPRLGEADFPHFVRE